MYPGICVSTYLLSTKSFNYVILSDNLNILLLDGAFILNDDLSDDVNIYPEVSPIINPEYPLLVKLI